MKKWVGAAIAVACLVVLPAQARAQSWVPFGTAYWASDGSGGYGLLTESATCDPALVTCPYGVTSGGIELVGGPTDPATLTPILFQYRSDHTGGGGGSPRLVVEFSDGGRGELRPINWVAGAWETVDGLAPSANVGWDNNGGPCGYRYNVSWTEIMGCHAGETVTAIYLVNDSGWLYDPEQVMLRAVNVNDIRFGPTKNDCKKGGFVALGFKNEGLCVSSFVRQNP